MFPLKWQTIKKILFYIKLKLTAAESYVQHIYITIYIY